MGLPIIGERVILRVPEEKDIQLMVEYLQDSDIGRYIPPIPKPYTKGDAEWYVGNSKKEVNEVKGFAFAMHHKLDDRIIGTIAISNWDKKSKKAEVGYWLAKSYWRQGLTSEALDLMLGFGFNELHLNRIYAKVIVPNQPSAKLLLKKGFILEGTEREAELIEGNFCDCEMYGLLKSEYQQ